MNVGFYIMIFWIVCKQSMVAKGAKCFEESLNKNSVTNRMVNPPTDPNVYYLGFYSDPSTGKSECQEACRQHAQCTTWTYVTANHGDNNLRYHCYGRNNNLNTLNFDHNMVSGVPLSCHAFDLSWISSPTVNLEDSDVSECVSTTSLRYTVDGNATVTWIQNSQQNNITLDVTLQGTSSCDVRYLVIGRKTQSVSCTGTFIKPCDVITPAPTNQKCSYRCTCDSNPCSTSILIGSSSVPDSVDICKIEYNPQ